jgi:N-succinyl-L-ornithine transcarbamylase
MMRNFLSANDVEDVELLAQEVLELKKNPFQWKALGENKTMVLIFLNSSLRTRSEYSKSGSKFRYEYYRVEFRAR